MIEQRGFVRSRAGMSSNERVSVIGCPLKNLYGSNGTKPHPIWSRISGIVYPKERWADLEKDRTQNTPSGRLSRVYCIE